MEQSRISREKAIKCEREGRVNVDVKESIDLEVTAARVVMVVLIRLFKARYALREVTTIA